MEDLRSTLGHVRDRIRRHRGAAGLTEQDTKATLIAPLLRALGWNVEDVDHVRHEYKARRHHRPVDYALLVSGEPKLFLEAKALREALDDPKATSQIMGYASESGVEWIVLTNGDEWRLYNAHAPVAVEEKLFRTVRVSEAGAEETLRLLARAGLDDHHLDRLWKTHFVDRKVKEALERFFTTDAAPAVVRFLRKRIRSLTAKEIRASLARAHVAVRYSADPEECGAGDGGDGPRPTPEPTPKPAGGRRVTLKDLVHAGILVPPLELRTTYRKRHLTAQVVAPGRIRFEGALFDSPSAAGAAARASVAGRPKTGTRFQTDGWTFWRYAGEEGKERPLDDLRRRYLAREGGAADEAAS